jgi:hypothetical protein
MDLLRSISFKDATSLHVYDLRQTASQSKCITVQIKGNHMSAVCHPQPAAGSAKVKGKVAHIWFGVINTFLISNKRGKLRGLVRFSFIYAVATANHLKKSIL